ncbi:NADH-quinone oxidoreductase subunit C [Streptomyces sp. NPDC101230]|uniref:NADH-quinone oxidoreductase subunit C n=1 Tax=unclassified Streptomyces TaxID=2593676 RepID=UPI0038065817
MSERRHEAHHPYDRLPDAVTELFGEGATAESAYDLLTVDIPATEWITALRTARDGLGCTYFDWLSAVDEPGTGFRVCAHVAALGDGTVRRLMLRTTVPHDAATLPSAIDVYAGAAWHERETHEMFGVAFEDHPGLAPLLLPEGFEGHPLRKDFVLAARVAKAWPGAKEPGESEHGGPKRRTMLPPGVPDPNEWGPLKGQLPPAAPRPGRASRPAAGAADRPPRRTRSASDGSAAQRPRTGPPEPSGPESADSGAPTSGARGAGGPAPASSAPGSAVPGAPEPGDRGAEVPAPEASAPPAPGGAVAGAPAPASSDAASPDAVQPPSAPAPPGGVSSGDVPPVQSPAARPRRSRSASDGSASQQQGPEAAAPRPPRRSRSASQGSASQRARSTDAPWHDAQPAFDEPDAAPDAVSGRPDASESRRSSGTGDARPEPRRSVGSGNARSQPQLPSESDGPEPPSHSPKHSEGGDPDSQPLRRLRSGDPEAEPPVREGAGRGEAARSGPTSAPTEPRTAPDPDRPPTDDPTPTKAEPPSQPKPDPDHPAGGDTE